MVALVQPTHITAFSAPDAPASLSMPQITSRVVESAFERGMWDVLGDWPRQTSYTPVLLELPVTVRPVSHRYADKKTVLKCTYLSAPSSLVHGRYRNKLSDFEVIQIRHDALQRLPRGRLEANVALFIL